MSKPMRQFAVYATDLDGSERKAGTYDAKSAGHARKIAMESHGVRRITSVEEIA